MILEHCLDLEDNPMVGWYIGDSINIDNKSSVNYDKKFQCIECEKEMGIIQHYEVNYAYQGYQYYRTDYCHHCQLIRKSYQDRWYQYD